MNYDYERLRKDLLKECEIGFFGGGMDSDLIAAIEIEDADDNALIQFAKEFHLPLWKYQI